MFEVYVESKDGEMRWLFETLQEAYSFMLREQGNSVYGPTAEWQINDLDLSVSLNVVFTGQPE